MRPETDSLVLLAASLALAILLAESAGPGVALPPASAWIASIPAVAVGLGTIARERNMHCLHVAILAVMFGSIGMLAGAWLDFGPFGLAALAAFCSALPPLGLDSITGRFAPAPWTYLGMLVGCNLGMALSNVIRHGVTAPSPGLMTRVACCNAGMAIGMVISEAVLPTSSPEFAGIPTPLRMLLVMVLGMAAGMTAGAWIAEQALRRRARTTRLAALPRTPGLRS